MEQTRCLFARATQIWLAVNHNTSITSGERVRRVLHGPVSLEAVNQICVIDEAMNGCKNIKQISVHYHDYSSVVLENHKSCFPLKPAALGLGLFYPH